MKSKKLKNILLLFMTFIMLLTSTHVVAQEFTQYYSDGRWHDYTFDPTYVMVNGTLLATDVPPLIFNDHSIVPARAVFEQLGAQVRWDGSKNQVAVSMEDTNILLEINSDIAIVNGKENKMAIAAKNINDRTMIPTRFVAETLGMDVDWIGAQRIITIDYEPPKKETAKEQILINDVDYSVNLKSVTIAITADKPMDAYHSFWLEDPKRLVVDIENAIWDRDIQKIDIMHAGIASVRVSQFDKQPYITRFVVDVDTKTSYKVSLSEDKKQLYIIFRDEPSMINGVNFTRDGEQNIVEIDMDFLQKPHVFRLSNPDRIVIDMPTSKLNISEKIKPINANIVKSIRYGQFNKDTARIVLDVGGQPQFEIQEIDGKIIIMLSHPSYRNIYYSNNEKPALTIYSHVIGQRYTEVVNMEDIYTLSVPLSSLDLGTGRMDINDEFFEFIYFEKNIEKQTTDIIFKAKNAYEFIVSPSEDSAKTIVRMQLAMADNAGNTPDQPGNKPQVVLSEIMLDPRAKNKIVVVDPGHGGSDPGAIYGGITEKDLNLDISLRLYELLKQGGVKVYMTRTDDRFIPLQARSEFANQLDASLFVSVHNNAMADRNYDGSMMLYYPSPFSSYHNMSGRRLSQILQTELVTRLGTTDRGLRERPNLAVLRRTKMPAVIVEVAFMTNAKDLANLKTNTFRQKSAEAIYVGIIKALNESVR